LQIANYQQNIFVYFHQNCAVNTPSDFFQGQSNRGLLTILGNSAVKTTRRRNGSVSVNFALFKARTTSVTFLQQYLIMKRHQKTFCRVNIFSLFAKTRQLTKEVNGSMHFFHQSKFCAVPVVNILFIEAMVKKARVFVAGKKLPSTNL
jgi:hypothetical protein